MRRCKGLAGSAVFFLFLLLSAGWETRVSAAVYRDRAAFNAATQNLQTIDFENQQTSSTFPYPGPVIDGLVFESFFGSTYIGMSGNPANKMFVANGVPEITQLRVLLPPGTTALACDQFTHSMSISISSGESVMIEPSDQNAFVGFISDTAIESVTFLVDFPEPTDAIVIDNLSFGQRRTGNEPPQPTLLVTRDTGRAVAFDSVTNMSEPFSVVSTLNFSSDHHTRLTLFLVGVRLSPQDVSSVTVQAEDAQHKIFNLPVESVGMTQNLGWMAEVTIRLTDELNGAGDVSLSVSVRGATSNKASINIKPSVN